MKFEKYSNNVLENILQDLETISCVLQNVFRAEEFVLDRFEATLSSDFGTNLLELRNQNKDLTEAVRLKAIIEIDSLIEQIEAEMERRIL